MKIGIAQVIYFAVLLALIYCSGKRMEVNKNIELPDSTNVRQSVSSIDGTIETKEEIYSGLSKHNLLNILDLLLPDTFNVMSEEMVASRYPMKHRGPFITYTNGEGDVNIAIEHSPDLLLMHELLFLQETLVSQFSQPGIDLRRHTIEKINGRDFVILEMISPGQDGQMCNFLFATSVQDRLLIGSLNYPLAKMKTWHPAAKMIVGSLKIKE